jgi:hypothetical protein
LWLPFSQISHLRMLKDYFEAVGVWSHNELVSKLRQVK